MSRRCDMCGERADDEMAEVWNPAEGQDSPDAYCHASCIPEGWEIA